jgi:hypothetical protein
MNFMYGCYYRGPQPIPTSADYHEAGVSSPGGW